MGLPQRSPRGRLCLQILVVLEEKVRSQKYEAGHVRTVLSFETESVPVQQFQASIAQRVIEHSEKGIFVPGTGFEAIINLALRVGHALPLKPSC